MLRFGGFTPLWYRAKPRSSSSTRGRRRRRVRSSHGPILGAIEGVSSIQTTDVRCRS